MPMGQSDEQLSPEEIAEYRALRESQRRAQEEYDAANTPPAPTHYLHLANGEVIESAGTMTHYKGQAVVLAVPKEG